MHLREFNLRVFLNERLAKKIHRSYALHIKSDSKKELYAVLGIRRSGNHALINWLIHQMDGQVSFCNDMGPDGFPENSRFKESRFSLKSKKHMIISHEDHHVTDIFDQYLDHLWGASSNYYNILLLRNPYNLFASWYRWDLPLGTRFRTNEVYRNSMIDLWLEHAENFVSWNKNPNDINIPILFDQLISNEKYRSDISRRMNLNGSDRGLKLETKYGGGSSFGQIEKGQLERWKKYEEDDNFKSILNDTRITTLWEEVQMFY